MTRYQDHFYPPSHQPSIDLRSMTVRELGELAEAQGMTLLDILTL